MRREYSDDFLEYIDSLESKLGYDEALKNEVKNAKIILSLPEIETNHHNEDLIASLERIESKISDIENKIRQEEATARSRVLGIGSTALAMVSFSAISTDIAVAIGSRFFLMYGGLISSAIGVMLSITAIIFLLIKMKKDRAYSFIKDASNKAALYLRMFS